MRSEQNGISGLKLIEEADIYDKAEKQLKATISSTRNVTFLKKVIASGLLVDEAILKLIDLAFPEEGKGSSSSEALLEVLIIFKESKKLTSKVKNRMDFVTGRI